MKKTSALIVATLLACSRLRGGPNPGTEAPRNVWPGLQEIMDIPDGIPRSAQQGGCVIVIPSV